MGTTPHQPREHRVGRTFVRRNRRQGSLGGRDGCQAWLQCWAQGTGREICQERLQAAPAGGNGGSDQRHSVAGPRLLSTQVRNSPKYQTWVSATCDQPRGVPAEVCEVGTTGRPEVAASAVLMGKEVGDECAFPLGQRWRSFPQDGHHSRGSRPGLTVTLLADGGSGRPLHAAPNLVCLVL